MVAHGTEGISFRGERGRLESPGPSHVHARPLHFGLDGV